MDFKRKYTLITCANNKNVIGKNGDLLYHIKGDMANFKSLTMGNVVIMGRKTFESLPGKKPLKDRINIIITNQPNYEIPNYDGLLFREDYVVHSLKQADELCATLFPDKECFIIGGSQIYNQAYEMGLADKIILTHVYDDTEGDTYFPVIDEKKYRLTFKTTSLRDQKNNIYYRYLVYKQKKY